MVALAMPSATIAGMALLFAANQSDQLKPNTSRSAGVNCELTSPIRLFTPPHHEDALSMFDIGEAIMGTVEAIGYAIDSVQQGLTYTIQENSNFGAHLAGVQHRYR